MNRNPIPRWPGLALAALFAGVACLCALACQTASAQTNVAAPAATALSFRDPASGIIFYVESDGHHVVALDKDGKVLWRRTPATDGNLPPYSADYPALNPTITYLGPDNRGNGKKVGIGFRNRQAGTLDITTGDFNFGGQD